MRTVRAWYKQHGTDRKSPDLVQVCATSHFFFLPTLSHYRYQIIITTRCAKSRRRIWPWKSSDHTLLLVYHESSDSGFTGQVHTYFGAPVVLYSPKSIDKRHYALCLTISCSICVYWKGFLISGNLSTSVSPRSCFSHLMIKL